MHVCHVSCLVLTGDHFMGLDPKTFSSGEKGRRLRGSTKKFMLRLMKVTNKKDVQWELEYVRKQGEAE